MRRPDPARLHRRGVTLIELAATLAVIAILAGIALPFFGDRLERARVRHAAEQLAADIAEARFEAARGGIALHLQVTAGPAWCWTVATTPGCSCGPPQACRIHGVDGKDHPRVRLLQGLTLELDAAGTPAQTRQTARAVLLGTSRGEEIAVQVSALGRTRVCAHTPNAWPDLPAC